MRRRAPRPLSAALSEVLAAAGPDTLLARVQRCWAAAVGPAVAAEAEPVRERDGVIAVECRSATWAAELDLMQARLVERLNGTLEGAPVRGLRFTATG